MKKFILGLVLGAILIPVSVSAWNARQMSQAIFGFDCAMASKMKDPTHYEVDANDHPIPDPLSNDSRCSGTVYVFDDAGNKCYVAKVSNGAGISCLKK